MSGSGALVIVGAGGFGREAADVVLAARDAGVDVDLAGVLDDAPSETNLLRLEARGIRYLGDVDAWLGRGDPARYLIGVGSPTARRCIDRRLAQAGLEAACVIHPQATVGSQVTLGPGSVVCSGARVSTNVTLGRHTHVNANCCIGHDTVLSDYVSLNPGALISGDCSIGAATLIGVGATVLQGLSVGSEVTVGGSACLTKDVRDGLIVKGVPAR